VGCAAQALNVGSENTSKPESVTPSDSNNDDRTACTKKKEKSRCGSGTFSISRPEFEKEKAKRIARNKKLLLEMSADWVEEVQDIDQETREHEQNPESELQRDDMESVSQRDNVESASQMQRDNSNM